MNSFPNSFPLLSAILFTPLIGAVGAALGLPGPTRAERDEASGEKRPESPAVKPQHKLHQHVQPHLAVLERYQLQRAVADARPAGAVVSRV